eukprot:2194715-Pyramimonas_sp.AAC.2
MERQHSPGGGGKRNNYLDRARLLEKNSLQYYNIYFELIRALTIYCAHDLLSLPLTLPYIYSQSLSNIGCNLDEESLRGL